MSAWKTEPPKETGDYIVKVRSCGMIKVETDYFVATRNEWRWYGERVIKWCPIPEDEEGENG